MAAATRKRAPSTAVPNLTVREAAHILNTPERRIQRAIDRRRLHARLRRIGRQAVREIPIKPLLEYAVEQRAADYVLLTKTARDLLQDALASVPVEAAITAQREHRASPLLPAVSPVSVGPVTLRLDDTVFAFIKNVMAVLNSREMVVGDPATRGGEPVVRGSRVPVYRLAELQAQGVPTELLLEEHPSLTPESLEGALLYAKLHPRAGRPARAAPWHGGEATVLLRAREGPRTPDRVARNTRRRDRER